MDLMDSENQEKLELAGQLKCIKDRCSPPETFWFKTYYAILFFLSCVPYVSHEMAFGGVNFDLMRMPHGLLPIQALMMRNTVIPYVLPAIVFGPAFLAIWFRKLRSGAWLSILAVIVLILMSIYLWLNALFTMSLTLEFTKQ